MEDRIVQMSVRTRALFNAVPSYRVRITNVYPRRLYVKAWRHQSIFFEMQSAVLVLLIMLTEEVLPVIVPVRRPDNDVNMLAVWYPRTRTGRP